MKLKARPEDDLKWEISGTPDSFEFDFGPILLEDELAFNATRAALAHFSKEVWPKFPESKVILYRGSADFSKGFEWTERQEANFLEWRKGLPENDEEHLKRIFCAEIYIAYFQMLSHKLPDEAPIILSLDPERVGTPAQKLQLLSSERFEHFQIEIGPVFDSNIGICFPPDTECSGLVLRKIDRLIETLSSFRAVYENLLTEEWHGLDEIYVIPEALTERGRRKLKGFEAAGGQVIAFGAEGFSLRAIRSASRPAGPICGG